MKNTCTVLHDRWQKIRDMNKWEDTGSCSAVVSTLDRQSRDLGSIPSTCLLFSKTCSCYLLKKIKINLWYNLYVPMYTVSRPYPKNNNITGDISCTIVYIYIYVACDIISLSIKIWFPKNTNDYSQKFMEYRLIPVPELLIRDRT